MVCVCCGSDKPTKCVLNESVTGPPRPFHKMKEYVTSLLHVPLTLQFTAIAYPPLGPEGFTWAKQNSIWWTPLLSNADLQISSAALQSNLTILNVSYEDFGIYRLNATNSKGSYVQYFHISRDSEFSIIMLRSN